MTKDDLKRLGAKYRWTEEEGRGVLEMWRASGQTQGVFARIHGIPARRMRRWARHPEGPVTDRETVSLVPVEIIGDGAAAIEIVMGSRVVRVMPGFDSATLRRVLEVLSGC